MPSTPRMYSLRASTISHVARSVFFFSIFLLSVPLSASAQTSRDVGIQSLSVGPNPGVYSTRTTLKAVISYENTVRPWDSLLGGEFLISYRVGNGPIVTERPVNINYINSGFTAEYTFQNAPDLSQGDKVISAMVSMGSDNNSANNMATLMVDSLAFPSSGAVISEFPYSEDFEAGAGNWTAFAYGTGPTGFNPIGFQLGTPLNSPLGTPRGQLSGAASGTKAWKTNIDSPRYYSSNTQTQVVSPVFDFRDIPYLEISLAAFWESSPGVDGAALQASTDGGNTWTTVGAQGDPDNWYNRSDVSSLGSTGAGTTHGWSGYVTAGSSAEAYSTAGTPNMFYTTAGTNLGSDVWVTARNTLQGGQLTQLRVIFNSGPTGSNSLNPTIVQSFKDFGFAFDDVEISEGATATMAAQLLSDVNMDSKAGQGDTVRYTVTVTNTSAYGLTNVSYADALSDSFLSLVSGTVTTSSGAITSGNGGSDTAVGVAIGALAAGADVTIQFTGVVGAAESSAAEVCGQGEVEADEFNSFTLPTNDASTAERADATCLPVAFVDGDGDNLPDGGDADLDGLTNGQEFTLGTNPNNANSDGDGGNDKAEVDAGSDPLEPNSEPLTGALTRCTDWNGFLAGVLTQILEQSNASSGSIDVATRLRDIDGVVQSLSPLTLAAGQQFDLIVNGLSGFASNSYGTLCSTINSGPAGSLEGQLVSYRFNAAGSYGMAVVDPLEVGRTGVQFLSYNNYQPSANVADGGDFIAGWVQIVNEETTPQTGALEYYDLDGVMVRAEAVSLTGEGRKDLDAHTIGANTIGLLRWVPTSSTARFRVKKLRYYFNGPLGTLTDLLALNSTAAKKGTGSRVSLPVDTRGRIAVLELSNVLSTAVSVDIGVRDAAGAVLGSTGTVLGGQATRHFVINESLPSGLGNLLVDSASQSSVIATVYYYGRAANGSLVYTDSVPLSDGNGDEYFGTYNTFLNQGCSVQVSNRTQTAQNAMLTMTRADSTVVLNNSPITVPANGALEVDICNQEIESVYGQLKLDPTTPGSLVAVVKRVNAEQTVQFSVPMR